MGKRIWIHDLKVLIGSYDKFGLVVVFSQASDGPGLIRRF